MVNPLNPVYHVLGTEIKAEDFGTVKPPPEGRTDRRLDTSDIDGAQADSMTRRYRSFKTAPFAVEGDEEGPAAILMVPSMKAQGRELEMQQKIREFRGERIRVCENRHLTADLGTGDPLQVVLRKQRARRSEAGVRDTFF
jgi:hypothetical protein